jgi:hypothetical protein
LGTTYGLNEIPVYKDEDFSVEYAAFARILERDDLWGTREAYRQDTYLHTKTHRFICPEKFDARGDVDALKSRNM